MIRSFQRLQSVNPGFNPEGVLLVRVSLPKVTGDVGAQSVFTQREAAFDQITERIAGVPGVQRVGAISSLLMRVNANESITIEGQTPGSKDKETDQLGSASVSPGFFQTLSTPLRRGRFFTRDDARRKIVLMFNSPAAARLSAEQPYQPAATAAIINDTFAHRFFPGADPIGKRFYEGQLTGNYSWYEIVGVVGDMHRQGLEQQPVPEYFVPHIGGVSGNADLAVRTENDPLSLIASVRQAILSVDRNALILNATTAEHQMGELSAQRRFQTWLLVLFAVLGTHEIGVRIALGAQSSNVLWLVISQGLKLVAIGVAIGLLLSFWLTDVISHLLFGVSAHDPITFVGVTLMLLGVSFLACFIPARRAARVDPLVALRYE